LCEVVVATYGEESCVYSCVAVFIRGKFSPSFS